VRWLRRKWAVRDYEVATGERVSNDENLFWTRAAAERFARLHRRLFGTRGGQYWLRVEPRYERTVEQVIADVQRYGRGGHVWIKPSALPSNRPAPKPPEPDR